MECRSYAFGFHHKSLQPMWHKQNCGWTPTDGLLACWWFVNWSCKTWYSHSIPYLDCKTLQHTWQKTHSHLRLISWLSGHKYQLLWSWHGEIWYGSIHQKNYWCFPWKDHGNDFYSSCWSSFLRSTPQLKLVYFSKTKLKFFITLLLNSYFYPVFFVISRLLFLSSQKE